jgi:Putative zinc-finger
MLNCKQASQLLSQSLERKLNLRERWAIRWHLLICDMCTQFAAQLNIMRNAIRQMTQSIELDSSLQLSESAKQRIMQAMQSHTAD